MGIVENPSLDLEAYANAYTGLAKLYRLQFISDHCPCYRVEALKLAIGSCQNTSVSNLENELMKLILDGSIQARIDSHNKVLLAQNVDQRSQTFSKAVEMAELYQRRARMLVLRSAILKSNISVKCVTRDQQEHNNYTNGTN